MHDAARARPGSIAATQRRPMSHANNTTYISHTVLVPRGTRMARTFATGLAVACYAGLVAAQSADKDDVGISVENGDAFGVVEAQSVSQDGKGIPGYTTYRLSLQLSGDAANVYTIFGRENAAMSFPAAYQVAAPFGSNVSLALTA